MRLISADLSRPFSDEDGSEAEPAVLVLQPPRVDRDDGWATGERKPGDDSLPRQRSHDEADPEPDHSGPLSIGAGDVMPEGTSPSIDLPDWSATMRQSSRRTITP